MSVCYLGVQSLNREDCEALHDQYAKDGHIGDNGQVYEVCTKRNRECEYVLKVITYEDGVLAEVEESWEREVRLMRQLNVYQRSVELVFSPILYDAWKRYSEEKTYFYILMEKYDGSLYDIFEKYDINEKRYALQVLATMDVALVIIHTQCRICLNDIKLENILYRRINSLHYKFVFADFSLSTDNATDACIKEDRSKFKSTVRRFEEALKEL
jgi:serine/threonine protein kinase